MEATVSTDEQIQQEAIEPWLLRLKAAVDAGFYRTEGAQDEQTQFPWQGRYCQDCIFWSGRFCGVHEESRSAMAHTCRSFDQRRKHHEAAID